MESTSLNSSNTTDTDKEVNLWLALRRHWLAVALVTIGISAVSVNQAFKEPRTYQSEALLLVANKVSVPIIRSEEGTNSSEEELKNLSTDIEIFKSPSLLSKALKKLDTPYQNISVQDIGYNLSLRQHDEASVLSITYQDTNPSRAKAVLEALVATYLDYSKESRRSPVTNAIQFIEVKLPAAKATLEKSSAALTNFRTKHNLDNPDSNANSAYQKKEELVQQVAQAEIEVNQIQQKYQELQRQMNQIGQNPKTAVTDSVLSQNDSYKELLNQLAAIDLQYAVESSRYTQNHPIVKDLKARRDQLNILLQKQIQRVIGSQHSQVADKTLTSGSIQQNLTNQLMQTQIDLLVKNKQLSDLRQIAVQSNLNFERIAQLQQQYRNLERQHQFNSQTVDNFLSKLQELRVREAQETSSWKVLEPPVLPTVPAGPNRKRGLILGFIGSALGGVATAYLLEKMNRSFKEISEIKNVTNLPVLVVLPQANAEALSRTKEFELFHRSEPFTEAIRSLALSLFFQKSSANSLKPSKVLAITSSISEEGRSTVIYNLGLALAEIGQRVLIVDADLSQPSLHKVFGLSNATGLTTAIATDIPWQKLIQSTSSEAMEGNFNNQQNNHFSAKKSHKNSTNGSRPIFAQVLTSTVAIEITNEDDKSKKRHPDILTSGPLPSSSIAWLVSEKMLQLLKEWRQAYDYVLLDTSPITELADAQSLMPIVDEIILVVNMKKVTHSSLTQTTDILQRTHSNVIGMVINNLN